MIDLLVEACFDRDGPWILPLEPQGLEIIVSVGSVNTFTYTEILETVSHPGECVKAVVHLLNDEIGNELITSGEIKTDAKLTMFGAEEPLGYFIVKEIKAQRHVE